MEGLTPGRIAHYVLSESDIAAIKEKREKAGVYGNSFEVGEHVPMMVVKVWNDQGMINGRLITDGDESPYWVTSRRFSENPEPATWHWIEKA